MTWQRTTGRHLTTARRTRVHRAGVEDRSRVRAAIRGGVTGRIGVRAAVGIVVVASAAACAHDGRTMRQPRPDQTKTIATTTTVPPAASTQPAPTSAPAASASPAAPTSGSAAGSTTAAGDGSAASDGDGGSGSVAPATATAIATAGFAVAVPWPAGGAIDPRFTCSGEDAQPTFAWQGTPIGTVELALAVTDNDAHDFVHFVVAGLGATTSKLDDGPLPAGGVIALNGFNAAAWYGPCPPSGSNHRYVTRVFALNAPSGVTGTMTGLDALAAIQAHTIAVASVDGTFGQ